MVGAPVGRPSQSSSPARRSRGRVLPTTQILTIAQVTRGGPCLGHVSPIHSPPRCHVSRNDSTVQLPTVRQLSPMALPHHRTTLPHHRTTLPRQHPVLWTVQSANFFCLFDNLNRMRYLTHPTSV
jgi:hypothetical protein